MSNIAQPSHARHNAMTSTGRESLTAMLRRSVSAHSIFIGLTLFYWAMFLTFVNPIVPPATQSVTIVLAGLFLSLVLSVGFNLGLLRFYYMARYEKPKHPLSGFFRNYWRFVTNKVNIAHGLPILVLMKVFGLVYISIKKNITAIQPFAWDKSFYELDKWLHFGVDPWKIFHPVMSIDPGFVFILNLNYNLWLFVMWMILVWFAFNTSHTKIRSRFFVSFFLAWSIGGGLLAILLSSAGPGFYSGLNAGPDPYADLMAHLQSVREQVPVWALDLQEAMWLAHQGNGVDVGISAMPSMHNASALLFVLATWNVNRKVAWILLVHCALIYVGSIYLAWHYAVDAWVSWALVAAFWWGSKPIVEWWHARPEWRTYEAPLISAEDSPVTERAA